MLIHTYHTLGFMLQLSEHSGFSRVEMSGELHEIDL